MAQYSMHSPPDLNRAREGRPFAFVVQAGRRPATLMRQGQPRIVLEPTNV